MTKALRSQVALALLLAAVAIGIIAATSWQLNSGSVLRKLGLSMDVGGPFEMQTHLGGKLTDRDLSGKPFAIFFGFTQCPDVCPTSLLELTELIDLLGSEADAMRFLFVTVDPERDTRELLATYLSSFDKRIIGLLGTPDQVADMAALYRVYYEKVQTKNDYTINHTATTYVMDRRGRLTATLAYRENMNTRLEKLRRVIAESRQEQ